MKDHLQAYSDKLKWLVFLSAVLLYANTFTHDYALDDYSVIVTHAHVQNGLDGIGKIISTNYRNGNSGFNDGLYRPLSLISFALEKEFFNSNLKLAHGINILLYALGCCLLFVALRRIFVEIPLIVPLAITFIFLAHPIHTEVVANIKGRDDLFAFVNFSACLIYLLKYLENKKMTALLLALLFFSLALLSKESAVTFSVIIPMLLLLTPTVNVKKLIPIGIYLGALTLGFIYLRFSIVNGMHNPVDAGNFGLLNNPIAATENTSLKWGATFALQGIFLFKLLFPFQLLHDYSFNQIPLVELVSWQSILGIIILLTSLIASVWGLLKMKNLGIVAGMYFISIVVASQLFLTIGVQFAERMLFMAVLPFALFIVLAYHQLLGKKNAWLSVSQQKRMKWMVLLLIAIFSTQTFSRNKDWKNNFSLYKADIENGKNSARANYNLGSEYNEQATVTSNPQLRTSYFNESINYLTVAIRIYPEYYDAYNNLGLAYKSRGDLNKSIQVHEKNLKLNPDYTKGYYNLATTYAANKQDQKAISTMQQYVDRNPNNAAAYFFMGQSAGNLQDFNAAVNYLNQALNIEPNNPDYLNFLGMAYGMLGKNQEAENTFKTVLQQQPNRTDILMNLALSLHNQNKLSEERLVLKQLLSIDPNNQQAKQQLGILE